jgi:thiol-disulfide isomerase/thioredoxin
VKSIVSRELTQAKADGRHVLVYVGATWCEPCQRFHHAALDGKLDDELGKLTLVQFDLDRDRDRLKADGYTSDFIPLFTLPSADGTASTHHMEGSIKGDGAVAQIVPRLQALLAQN